MAHNFPALLNHEILKPSGTIHIDHNISLTEHQLWNKMFQNAYYELKEKGIFTIPVAKLTSIFPYAYRNTNHLKKCLKNLTETSIEFNNLNKGKEVWGVFTLLGHAKIEDGICTYEYSRALQSLMNTRTMYTKVNLLIQQRFKSKYSLALYELCLDYFNINQAPMMSLEKIRKYFGIEDHQYPFFKDLNRYVLKPAIKEVNTKTEIFIEIERQKEGRKISGIKFIATQNKKIPKCISQNTLFVIEDDIQSIGEKQDIIDKIQKIFSGISEKQIKNIVDSYPLEKIEIAIKYTKEKAGENPSGYFLEILKNENFGDEEIEAKKKREARREKRKQEFLQREKEKKIKKEKDILVQEFIEKNPEKYQSLQEKFLNTERGKMEKSLRPSGVKVSSDIFAKIEIKKILGI